MSKNVKRLPKENIKPAEVITVDKPDKKKVYLTLSFILPVVILGTALALHKLYPFGDQQILVGFDSLNQYYPFLSDFWHRIRSGSSLLWSWTGGGGIDYLGLYAYYLASPMNFLVALLPHEWLREAMAVMILIKIGLSGLFMAIYLRGTFKRNDLSLPVFSLFFALCAFTIAFYWHIIWLDTIALLPLVILGVQSFVKEGKYRLLIISLALSVYTNYFFGIYTCIFVALTFFCLSLIRKLSFTQFVKKLGLIALYSAIALGMTALLLLPAYFNIQNTVNIAQDNLPVGMKFYYAFSDILGNLIAFTTPAEMMLNDLPNIYSGMLTIILASLFICSPKIKPREKIVCVGLAAFIVLSCNLEILNYIWNGFYNTVGIRSRYTFLLSFVLIIMAYRAFTVTEQSEKMGPENIRRILFFTLFICAAAALGFVITELKTVQSIFVICAAVLCGYYLAGYFIFTKKIPEQQELKQVLLNILFMSASVVLILLMARNGPQESKHITGSAILCGVYIIAYFVFIRGTQKFRRAAILVVIITVLTEVSVSAYIGVSAGGLTNRDEYPDKNEQIQELLGQREPMGTDFYRTEFYNQFTSNDPLLYNYDGISFYSSTASDNLTEFLGSLGISGRMSGKRYVYSCPSTLIDSFMDVRYLVTRDGLSSEYNYFWEPVAEADGSLLLENNYYLPLGFMVNEETAGYKTGNLDPIISNLFINQNDLFKQSTGLDGELFKLMEQKEDRHDKYRTDLIAPYKDSFEFMRYSRTSNEINSIGRLCWDYQIQQDGTYYAFCIITNHTHMLYLLVNGQPVDTVNILESSSFIFPVGTLSEGDILSVFNPISSQAGSVNIQVARIDEELFAKGYNLLASETLELTKFSDTQVSGQITTAKGGLLYTSIPYEKNKWKAYINGTEAEIIPIGGAMSSLRLTPGTYDIEFRYTNRYFTAGLLVSTLSIAVFILLILKDHYGFHIRKQVK